MSDADNIVAFRTKPGSKPGFRIANCDLIVFHDDDTIECVLKGTVLAPRAKAEFKEDLAAEQRLAQEALERD
jgi:hypothetical protein